MPIDLGLSRITKLLSHLGNPHHSIYKSIHVAGTNGKGSTVAYLSSILTQAKIRNGRFTSPHLLYYNDCISIDNETYPVVEFNKISQLVHRQNEALHLQCTEFELLTVTAFKIFEVEKVELAIMEVGLGGRLDATNVLQPYDARIGAGVVACGITKIGIDHEGFLGDTLAQIAREKAGIMKQGIPSVVDATNDDEVLRVIRNRAAELDSDLALVGNGCKFKPSVNNESNPSVDDPRSVDNVTKLVDNESKSSFDDSKSTVDDSELYDNESKVNEFKVDNDSKSSLGDSKVNNNSESSFNSDSNADNESNDKSKDESKSNVGDNSFDQLLHTSPLKGEYQRQNFSVALKLIDVVSSQLSQPVSRDAIQRGVALTTWPGRLQSVDIPHRNLAVLLDGAHNESAAIELGKYLSKYRVEKRSPGLIFIVALTQGKSADHLLSHITNKHRDTIIPTTFTSPANMPWVRSFSTHDLGAAASRYVSDVHAVEGGLECLFDHIDRLRSQGDSRQVVVCGSLYLCSDVLRYVAG